MNRIRALDLFSGIGGNSYSFHSFAKACLYCEINEEAREYLTSSMAKGYIDVAPIAHDITKLKASDVGDVDFLTASWPCQGNSRCGLRHGLDDDRSGLVREVMRLAKELRPSLIFLENVKQVVGNGSAEYVLREIHNLGYSTAWCVLSANDVGRKHLRERFFLVASRCPEMLERCMHISQSVVLPSQSNEPRRLLTDLKHRRAHLERMSLLGNSVVPQCVKLAFEMCAHQILSAKDPADACGMHVYEWGAWDADQDHVFGFVKPEFPAPPSCNLVMNSNFFTFLEEDGTVATTENCTSGVITKDWTTTRWATPRTGCRVPARHFTFRSRTDLPSQLRFERETPDEDRAGT